MPKLNQEERTREWAIKNNMFSLKTHDGIVYSPIGEEIDVPNGITRYQRDPAIKDRCGWDIYYFDNNDVYRHTRTRDASYDGDYRRSLKAAIELYLERSKYPLLNGKTSQRPKEHKHKKMMLRHPGIRFGKAFLAKRKMHIYFFAVTVGKERKTVYIGTDRTWETNYDDKLLLAEQIHKEMKDRRDRQRSFIISGMEISGMEVRDENDFQSVRPSVGQGKGVQQQIELSIS